MTGLDMFTYSGQQVRTVIIDGEPWFVAKDACDVVGISKYRDAVAQLDPDERVSVAVDTPGGMQMMAAVNEPGLFALMLISRSPIVRDFQRWVRHEVLPTINRTGQFGSALPTDFAEALELAAAEVRQRVALEAQIAIDAPKVEAYETLMDADGAYSMDAAAKILGIGRTTLFTRLRAEGIIQAGQRTPYQRYAHHFNVTASTYTDSEDVSHTTFTSKVRPSGLDFIAKKLGLVAVAS
ncbi:BRO family protein [Microterricola gilva]|uniref:BRO family protein n=1 Tax=Microterricola gilva TaxID=393267 RepID=A0A4Q8AKA4_9MICO|nr:phage antirepressor KilAC domain-containing protein [Microterricola gilva]RZU64894.1 BRO family protein [Microterricola gilva]